MSALYDVIIRWKLYVKLHCTDVSVLVRNFKAFLTNFESQIDQGIQNYNRSPSLNGAEAFLNDI